MNKVETLEQLDPQHLTPTASLNRVRIVDLPGVVIDEPDIKGKTAHELLSIEALAGLVRKHAGPLNLTAPEDLSVTQLLRRFDCCFEASDPDIRSTAEAIARYFGRRLGYLLVTLKRGDHANRLARAEWNDSYWEYWANIRNVWLGGGLAGGQLGLRLPNYALQVLAESKITDCTVARSAHPSLLPLIGAARSAPSASKAAFVFDFGHSFTKRGYAFYGEDALSALRIFPAVPKAQPASLNAHSPNVQARKLADHMAATMVDTWHLREAYELGVTPAPTLIASIACYVLDGEPAPGQGGSYGHLRLLSNNVAQWFSRQVSERLGVQVEVVFIHDGTAAARTHAGEPNGAVIMLGTALGIGFPPKATLRPVAPGLGITPMPEFI